MRPKLAAMRFLRGMVLVAAAALVAVGIPSIAQASTASQRAGRVIDAGHPGTVVAYHPIDQAVIYGFGRVA